MRTGELRRDRDMPKGPKNSRGKSSSSLHKPVGLKVLSEHLKLSTATISAVLNDSPAARSIPQETKDRVWRVAEEFNYRPNFAARALRSKRTYTVAVLVPEISEGYTASIVAGIETQLLRDGYLYFVTSHRGQERLVDEYLRLLMHRSVDGFLLVNTPIHHDFNIPAVAVAGHDHYKGVRNIVLDNHHACWVAVNHLYELGHREIAFFKGHPGSADTDERWQGITDACRKLKIPVREELTIQLRGVHGGPEPSTPEEGYLYATRLLERGHRFSALFAFNDVSAMGAVSAIRDAGLRVPEDVSVVGFDDIKAAGYLNPRLTTVRQPLEHMGELAARTLVEMIATPEGPTDTIVVKPELVVRDSTSEFRITGAERVTRRSAGNHR